MSRRGKGPAVAALLMGVSSIVGLGVFMAGSPKAPLPVAEVDGDASSTVDLAGLRLPSGEQPRLTCAQAREVVRQARAHIFREPRARDEERFAAMAIDWLDPHGFWSAAKGAKIASSLRARRSQLLRELEGGEGECSSARAVGEELVSWIAELRTAYGKGATAPLDEALTTATFDERQLEVHPLVTVAALGERARALRAAYPAEAAAWIDRGEARLLPEYDSTRWSEIVLAALVRAYVSTVDPHGAWAPLDEESSVYDLNLTDRPPSVLFDSSVRTSFGLLVEHGARAPLRDGDILFSLGGHALAGLSIEESDQLAAAFGETEQPFEVVLVRDRRVERVSVLPETPKGEEPGHAASELDTELVEYGTGSLALVHIRDVRDSLGDEVTNVLGALPPDLVGMVLDLRGNSGGSTDGAAHALGAFLPRAPLFPMLHRDQTVEIQEAVEVERTFEGPLAVLVDRDTASAAEMIAGALLAYRRAHVVGEKTFGKGCAQEYMDDVAAVGVLRLTTLVFALPDGSALQQKGLVPTIPFPFSKEEVVEAERFLPNAPPSWAGPDVRDQKIRAAIERENLRAFPPHAGHVAGCDDPEACSAIRLLGDRGPVARKAPRRR